MKQELKVQLILFNDLCSLPKYLPPVLNCHTDKFQTWRVALLISFIFDVICTQVTLFVTLDT